MEQEEQERIIRQTFDSHMETVVGFRHLCSDTVLAMAERVVKCLQQGGKVCFFGNGGSAADAQHFAAEFVVRFSSNRGSLSALALTTDTSILTACANDFGYEEVFARQVEGLARPGDIVVGISTSGGSLSVVRGLQVARELGITTFAFTGREGRECAEHADQLLAVPSDVTARVQECHLLAGHMICDLAERAFLG